MSFFEANIFTLKLIVVCVCPLKFGSYKNAWKFEVIPRRRLFRIFSFAAQSDVNGGTVIGSARGEGRVKIFLDVIKRDSTGSEMSGSSFVLRRRGAK
jgi:hypothetical protein